VTTYLFTFSRLKTSSKPFLLWNSLGPPDSSRWRCPCLTTRGQQTAVASWGGLVRVFNPDGTVKAAHTFPQDVAGLTWSRANLVAGLADGRVLGLAIR
jgi:hypothetical protein